MPMLNWKKRLKRNPNNDTPEVIAISHPFTLYNGQFNSRYIIVIIINKCNYHCRATFWYLKWTKFGPTPFCNFNVNMIARLQAFNSEMNNYELIASLLHDQDEQRTTTNSCVFESHISNFDPQQFQLY